MHLFFLFPDIDAEGGGQFFKNAFTKLVPAERTMRLVIHLFYQYFVPNGTVIRYFTVFNKTCKKQVFNIFLKIQKLSLLLFLENLLI